MQSSELTLQSSSESNPAMNNLLSNAHVTDAPIHSIGSQPLRRETKTKTKRPKALSLLPVILASLDVQKDLCTTGLFGFLWKASEGTSL